MTEQGPEQHECLLRRLTLCDGETCVDPSPRARPCGCYCETIVASSAMGDLHALAHARHGRALVVARSTALMRTVEARRRLAAW